MDIYWDYKGQKLVAGLTSVQAVTALQMILRDLQSVNLYVVQPVVSATAYYELADPVGGDPAFGAKVLLDGEELIVATTWTRTTTGTYTGSIDLSSAALIAAMVANSLVLTGEFTLVDPASARNQASTQFELTVRKDVFRSGDSDLVSGATAPNFKVYNGNIYWYEPISELWYPLTVKNMAGTIMFAPGEGITI